MSSTLGTANKLYEKVEPFAQDGGRGKISLLRLLLEGHILLTSPLRHYCHKIKTVWVTAGLSWHMTWRGIWERTSKIRPFRNSSVVHLPLIVHLRGLKKAQHRTRWKYCSHRSALSSSMDTQSFCFILNPELSKFCKNSVLEMWVVHSDQGRTLKQLVRIERFLESFVGDFQCS